MPTDTRNTKWRQGDVLTSQAVVAIFPSIGGEDSKRIAVVISHHCDLAALESKEGECEVIIGKKVSRLDATAYGKNPRFLTIEYEENGSPFYIRLEAPQKIKVLKSELMKFDPNSNFKLDGRGLTILRNWLGSRYNREAFPEAFETLLRTETSSGVSVINSIETILKEPGKFIKMLLFELDQGTFLERTATDAPYELGINVVYEAALGDAAENAAKEVAAKLDSLFSDHFVDESGACRGINIIYSDEMSDEAVSIAAREKFQEWKLEHLSYSESEE